ncbi:MAG: WD40/YVTN/BNR-like repeat-containing protein, partial [Thermoanaerobaculia bacterium]
LVAYLQDANRDLFENPVVGTEVYRSDDAGATWKRTHTGRIEKTFYSYGYYFGRIAVDPGDPERLYLAGVPLISSTDGGKTWKGLDQRGVHGDFHAILVDPRAPQRVTIGNDGGINVSYDRGETWAKLNNLPVGQFTILAVDDADPYNIVGGLQDNGVMRGPSTYKYGKSDPQAWKTIYGGDGSCVAVDPKDNNLVYVALQFGIAARKNLKTGETTRIRPRPELSAKNKEKTLRYNWITPFVLSPHSNDILYYGTQRLDRSFDRGDTWTAISADLTSNPEQGNVPFGTITTIAESPKKFGVIYAGTDEGKVWGTRDGGVTWTDLSAGLAKGKWVTRVTASFFDEGTVYVTQSGYRDDDFAAYLFRSADYGKTWQSLAAVLPAEPINVVREDPKARHLLYIGTDSGVFVSLDRGVTWSVLSADLPHAAVQDLVVQKREGDLVVGTHGRSVYVAETAPLRKLKGTVAAEAVHAFPVKSVKSSPQRGYDEDPWTSWHRDDPVARIAYWAKGGEDVKLAVTDENGSVWRELVGTSAAGMNVVEYDLSADPKLADAAEAKTREKALSKEKEKEKDKDKEKSATPAEVAGKKAGPEEEEEEDDAEAGTSKPESEKPPAGPGKPLDEDLYKALADPLRGARKRYLPPGKYTIEIRAGAATDKTTLEVKSEEERPFSGGGAPTD